MSAKKEHSRTTDDSGADVSSGACCDEPLDVGTIIIDHSNHFYISRDEDALYRGHVRLCVLSDLRYMLRRSSGSTWGASPHFIGSPHCCIWGTWTSLLYRSFNVSCGERVHCYVTCHWFHGDSPGSPGPGRVSAWFYCSVIRIHPDRRWQQTKPYYRLRKVSKRRHADTVAAVWSSKDRSNSSSSQA